MKSEVTAKIELGKVTSLGSLRLSKLWIPTGLSLLNLEGQKVFFAQRLKELVNHVRWVMQIWRVWGIQHWHLHGLKCQLPGPQQGTDKESQKPQFGKHLRVKSLTVQGKSWQKTKSDVNDYYCRTGQTKVWEQRQKSKNKRPGLGLKYHQGKMMKVQNP